MVDMNEPNPEPFECIFDFNKNWFFDYCAIMDDGKNKFPWIEMIGTHWMSLPSLPNNL